MNPELLPSALGRITVPRFLSPSRWVDLETCALAVWAGPYVNEVLLDTPEMLFGSLLHTVRRRYLAEGPNRENAVVRVATLLGDGVSALEAELIAHRRGGCVPLRNAVGWRKWDDRVRRLERWAEALDPVNLRAPPVPVSGSSRRGEPVEPKDAFGEGPEPWWQAVPLRLRGQPDEAHATSTSELWITDLKTGLVFTPEGEFRPEIVAQLELYALMAEYLVHGTRVRLFVQHSSHDELRWDDETRNAISERLSKVSECFPVDSMVDAALIANPGVHCRHCKFRPACSAYLQRAPSWWRNDPGNPRPLPYDVWGRVARIDVGERVAVEILDAAGRTVQVEGLQTAHGWDGIAPGSMLYLFNLEPTEDTFQHGARVHPRNFHEASPGRAWSNALSVSVFS